jgi:hypothetical protein
MTSGLESEAVNPGLHLREIHQILTHLMIRFPFLLVDPRPRSPFPVVADR